MPQAAPNPIVQIIPLALIFIVFYFLIIKPQKDKARQHKNTVAGLKKNDRIVTVGGVHGTVINVKENTLIVRVDDNIKIEVDKAAVGRVVKTA